MSMRKRVLAGFALAVWLAGFVGPLARPLLAHEHDCQCTSRLCRCLSEHKKKAPRKCHPDGSPLPGLERCDGPDDEITTSSMPSILPPRPTNLQAAVVGPVPSPAWAAPSLLAAEINPPPPRTPLA
ncbi:MAG: hypothetical protein ACE5HB_04050 [Terriglobia bacterium]